MHCHCTSIKIIYWMRIRWFLVIGKENNLKCWWYLCSSTQIHGVWLRNEVTTGNQSIIFASFLLITEILNLPTSLVLKSFFSPVTINSSLTATTDLLKRAVGDPTQVSCTKIPSIRRKSQFTKKKEVNINQTGTRMVKIGEDWEGLRTTKLKKQTQDGAIAVLAGPLQFTVVLSTFPSRIASNEGKELNSFFGI